jgi:hypothetical protein
MPRRIPDITKIHRLSGFTPTCSLEQSLKSVIAHHQRTAAPKVESAPVQIAMLPVQN